MTDRKDTTTSLSPLHNRRFLRHYVEMVVAMFAGMLVLGVPGEALLRAAGSSTSDLLDDAPAVALLAMGIVMTIPMVWWMRRRVIPGGRASR